MQIFRLFILVVLGICTNSEVIAEVPEPKTVELFTMQKAVPVWVKGREKEMNLTLGFRGAFQAEKNKKTTLKITASTLYRVFLNGDFLGYGPARACHGYFRVDEYDLGKEVRNGENIVAVEVAGYNVNSFYTLDQLSFLQAEVQSGGKILLATGSSPGFEAFQLRERAQKVERYSFQRPFTEYYRVEKDFDQWKISAGTPVESLKLTNLHPVKLLPRNLLLPDFNLVRPLSIHSRGTIQFKKPDKYKKDRSLTQITDKFKGYKENELDVLPSQIIQEIINKTQDTISNPYTGSSVTLLKNKFAIFDFGINLSGFIGGKFSCAEPSTVIFYFDELLTGGDVHTKNRMPDVNNQVVYELDPGDYTLETFESYTFKYLKIIVPKGSVSIDDIYLREYAYPENPKAAFKCNNEKLNEIYKAARQSFRQNAVDVLTDCPSRERAGWLCDSYFSAIMEKDFTGHSAVTHNFYENYSLPESFDFLPDGMIPMCYPADHPDGGFIPNWALWFIIQIDDYAKRGGDPVLVAQLKPRIEKLLEYFARFENKDGLLEKLNGWIFVEWSKANDFVLDVNYPTNMLYSAALAKAATLYHNDNWLQKAAHIRQKVLEQSYNGNFFVDNAIRTNDGKLQVTQNTTEVCQYYAFFFDIATPETHPALWKKLITDFGPDRNDAITYPNVFLANAFIGNYLRMDILSRYGLNSQLFKEVQDYFYPMAKRTGTLWEHMGLQGSCNHGFASYIGHILYRDILGISQIDYLKKEVTIQFTDINLSECSGAIPVGEGSVQLKWKCSGNQIRYTVKVPSGYKVNVENLSSAKLIKNE